MSNIKNDLLMKCIHHLGDGTIILDESQKNKIENKLTSKVQFEAYGINWNLLPNMIKLNSVEDVLFHVKDINCYILWDEFTLPIVESNLKAVIKNIDEITMLAFDTWILGDEINWLLENHHEKGFCFSFL